MSEIQPLPSSQASAFNAAAQASRVANAAAARAGVSVMEVDDMASLRAASALFEAVWGRSPEGVPVSSELMRSLVHAGGCVTVAYDGQGDPAGAAVLAPAVPAGTTYSVIAAARPGSGDRGIGFALKLRQRSWALSHGFDRMVWTFDPLVRRNARFNLVKLGAEAHDYRPGFYGRMSDEINGFDDSDRLVATWSLRSPRAVGASEGTGREPSAPGSDTEVLAEGPDGAPMLRRQGRVTWCRVPEDIVAARRTDPALAAAWRTSVRAALRDAFGDGLGAVGISRDGWYHLTSEGTR